MARHGKTKVDADIDRILRRVYDDAAAEPLPDRLVRLAERLRERRRRPNGGTMPTGRNGPSR